MTRNEIFFLLVVLCAIAMLIALVPTRHNDVAFYAKDIIDWQQVNDAPQKKLTISWLGPPVYETAKEGTWIEEMLEARFNVDFKPMFLDWMAAQKTKPLMLGSGEVPDVTLELDPLELHMIIDQGFVMELPYEVILKHAPTYVKQLNRYGPEAWLYSSYQGQNYGIPTFAAEDIYCHGGLWRMDWLRKVGINKTPDTLEEMYQALWKFRHEDPDGDGKKDTYGFCPPMHWSKTYIDVFGAYGLLPQDFIMYKGQAVWGGILPEAKLALGTLRQWYKEGLLSPEYDTASQGYDESGKNSFLGGQTGYMNERIAWRDLDIRLPNSLYSRMKKLNPEAELAPAPPIKGVHGKRLMRVWGGPAHVLWFGRHIAKDPEKVIRVLNMLETLSTDIELFVESRIGKKDVHWTWSPEQGIYLLPPYDARKADKKNLMSVFTLQNAYGFFSVCSVPLESTRKYIPAGQNSFYEQYCNPQWGLMNVLGKSDILPSAGYYLKDLRMFQATVYAEIIRGDKPLDYFDEFVRLWRERGGDVLTREANEMLETRNNIYRKVGVTKSRSGDDFKINDGDYD